MKDTDIEPAELTQDAAAFASSVVYEDIPEDSLHIAKRCIIDGLAVMLAGTEQEAMDVAHRYLSATGGQPVAGMVGNDKLKGSPQQAAFWNGLAGHVMDWDDTQVAEGPNRPYGLLTHPTVPPLSAVLALTETNTVSGKDFLTSFVAGVEVESKIAEAINPDHYNLGFHTSGTIGTFGSAAASARLLQMDADQTAQVLGGAASMAAGIRANFGTMGKPMHVGRSSENGVTSALLVKEGFTFNPSALDGKWGYLSVAGRGGEPELVLGRFGNPFSISEPGLSIKPYPCGVLTHPSMDAMKALMTEHGLKPDDIEKVTLFASNNILHPIRFRVAQTELEAKFCMAFLLSSIILTGRAGKAEFTDSFVQSPESQAMQLRVETQYDPEIAAMGHDKILSRIEVVTRSGEVLSKFSDDRYRGGPQNPLSDAEVEGKFLDCVEGIMSAEQARRVLDTIWSLEKEANARVLLERVNG